MTGLEMAKKVHAKNLNLKAIVSSGCSTEPIHRVGPTAEGIVYLPKPYQVSDLGSRVVSRVKKACPLDEGPVFFGRNIAESGFLIARTAWRQQYPDRHLSPERGNRYLQDVVCGKK
jgi:hypothetical protein